MQSYLKLERILDKAECRKKNFYKKYCNIINSFLACIIYYSNLCHYFFSGHAIPLEVKILSIMIQKFFVCLIQSIICLVVTTEFLLVIIKLFHEFNIHVDNIYSSLEILLHLFIVLRIVLELIRNVRNGMRNSRNCSEIKIIKRSL